MEYRVTAMPYEDMKGPKYIRWSEDDNEYQGRRNNDWSNLDRHWLVITQDGVTFEETSGSAENVVRTTGATIREADINGALDILRRALTH